MMILHEDDRRTLQSFPEAKVLHAKSDTDLGNHFHIKKTEIFYLLEGACKMTVNGTETEMLIGQEYQIKPMEYHSFSLKKDSKLLCLMTERFDKQDDYDNKTHI